jgi:hypothetical protein
MSKPTRFNMVALNHGEHYYATMKVDQDGAYVLHSDFAEMQARLSNMDEELIGMRIDVLNDKVLRQAFMDKAREEVKRELKT